MRNHDRTLAASATRSAGFLPLMIWSARRAPMRYCTLWSGAHAASLEGNAHPGPPPRPETHQGVRETPSGAFRQGESVDDGSAALSSSVVVRALHVERVSACETEHNPILIVHPHRVPSSEVISEGVQPVSGRHLQIVKLGHGINLIEFAAHDRPQLTRIWRAALLLTMVESFSLLTSTPCFSRCFSSSISDFGVAVHSLPSSGTRAARTPDR